MEKTVPIHEKVCLTLEEAAEWSNIGINRLRTLTQEKDCDFVLKVGNRKTLIKKKQFKRWLDDISAI